MIFSSVIVFVAVHVLLNVHYCQTQTREVYPPVNRSIGKEPLYFGLMMSFGGDLDSSGAVLAVQVALEIINNYSRSGLLSESTLHYVLYDSQCNRTTALEEFFSIVFSDEYPAMALLGSGCSPATAATAEISHFYNLTQISCISYADELSNKLRFKLYYQLLPSERDIVHAFVSIIKYYQWRRVALLVQSDDRFTDIARYLKMLLLHNANGSIEVNNIYLQTQEEELAIYEDPFTSYFRIYVLFTSSKLGRSLICKAHESDISYPKYLFLTYTTDERNWWVAPEKDDTSYNCTAMDRASVLEYSLVVSLFQYTNFNIGNLQTNYRVEDTTITRQEFFHKYNEKLVNSPQYHHNEMSEYCFDATWSLAMAINNTLRDNGGFSDGHGQHLLMDDIFFNGLTGPVRFNNNGIRTTQKYRVFQFRRNPLYSDYYLEEFLVATSECPEESTDYAYRYVDGVNDSVLWHHGVPYDGVPNMEIVSPNVAVSIVYGIICSLGVVFAFSCLIFNLVFRSTKIIRLTSPNLNYVICIGAMISYFSTLMSYTQITGEYLSTAALCAIRLATLPVGYSLAFITVLAKLARVYLIFRSSKKKITIKDKHLFIFIAATMLFPIAIGLMFVLSRSIGPNVTLVTFAEQPSSMSGALGIETQYYNYRCPLKSFERIPTALIWVYLFILKIIALWLAFQIRKVKITGLNDSKFIAAIVYISSILLAINFVFYFTIIQYTIIFGLLFGSLQLINITVIVGLSFIPKSLVVHISRMKKNGSFNYCTNQMISLYRNPNGEGLFGPQSTSHGMNAVVMSGSENVEELKKKIMGLEKTIKKLQETITSSESST